MSVKPPFPENTQNKVFISYAWESDEYKADVLQFARWLALELRNRGHLGYTIVMDFLHSVVAPEEGWPAWMKNEIESAHTVLVLCSPRYLNAYNKINLVGRGSTFEGAIITQSLYNDYQRNKKFFPILPDNGEVAHIPKDLQPWWNSFHFHQNNEEILRLILRQNPTLVEPSDPVVEKQIAQEILLQVEAETKIIEEIAYSIDAKSEAMVNPVQALVRAFVALSSVEKMQIAKNIGIYNSKFQTLSPPNVDEAILHEVKNKNLVSQLWDEVAKINSTLQKNPFTN